MKDLVSTVDHLHSKGIMHRDIKPANIMIEKDSKRLVLLDFGLSEFYHPGREFKVDVATR